MTPIDNNSFLVECLSDLPELPTTIDALYLDLETSSGDPKETSLNPWKTKHCRAHLFAVTWDQHPKCYAVPRDLGIDFIAAVLRRARTWVNQNVKYDAHVCHNDLALDFVGEYNDTLTLAKLIDSDRIFTGKGGYGLDALSKDYLQLDLSYYYTSLKQWLDNGKDYGRVENRVLGAYACAQVQANRRLHACFLELLPAEELQVWETEKKLTTVLIAMERRGMPIDVEGVQVSYLKSLRKMMQLQEELEKAIGYAFNPKSNPDCADLFLNRFGMPPVYNEKKKKKSVSPSFDKKVLRGYLQLPDSPKDLIAKTLEYRHQHTMQSLFWEPWLKLHVNGILHSDNNQCVRSGRMSCKTPNNQQFNDEARKLILARPGHSLVVHDYSQIEYRFIVHYIENEKAIKAYQENPEMDWHQFMADAVGIGRKPAKILNLAMGYGMGKGKTVNDLMLDPDMLAQYGGDDGILQLKALDCHKEFHERLPELRTSSRKAERAARKRGYVRNDYRRRCHLPLEFAHAAFNRVCQSHAADLIKERAVALHEELDFYHAHMLALVHDETVSECPTELAKEYSIKATEILNQSSVPIRVPVRCSCGISTRNWYEAKEGPEEEDYAEDRSIGDEDESDSDIDIAAEGIAL